MRCRWHINTMCDHLFDEGQRAPYDSLRPRSSTTPLHREFPPLRSKWGRFRSDTLLKRKWHLSTAIQLFLFIIEWRSIGQREEKKRNVSNDQQGERERDSQWTVLDCCIKAKGIKKKYNQSKRNSKREQQKLTTDLEMSSGGNRENHIDELLIEKERANSH